MKENNVKEIKNKIKIRIKKKAESNQRKKRLKGDKNRRK